MEAAVAGEHLGMAGMRERAQRADGRLDLISEPGRGTTVSVSLPIRETPGTFSRHSG
jgi:signal transduction histidine kinase